MLPACPCARITSHCFQVREGSTKRLVTYLSSLSDIRAATTVSPWYLQLLCFNAVSPGDPWRSRVAQPLRSLMARRFVLRTVTGDGLQLEMTVCDTCHWRTAPAKHTPTYSVHQIDNLVLSCGSQGYWVYVHGTTRTSPSI